MLVKVHDLLAVIICYIILFSVPFQLVTLHHILMSIGATTVLTSWQLIRSLLTLTTSLLLECGGLGVRNGYVFVTGCSITHGSTAFENATSTG